MRNSDCLQHTRAFIEFLQHIFSHAVRRGDLTISHAHKYLTICMDALVRALDEDQVVPRAAAEAMVCACDTMAGLLVSQHQFNEASRLWLHVLGFLPFLHERGGDCNVGTVLQQAHNVFEAAAAAASPEQQSALELEFDPTLLAAALQIIVSSEQTSVSSEYDENSGISMNVVPDLPVATAVAKHSRQLEVQMAQKLDHVQCTTVGRTFLPLPSASSTVHKSARARSRVPLPLGLRVGPDSDCLQRRQESKVLPESAASSTDKPLTLCVGEGTRLWSPVPDVSPDCRASMLAKGDHAWDELFATDVAYTLEVVPTGGTARYDECSSDEPSSPSFSCPASHLSLCDTTPQLWGVPMKPAAVAWETAPDMCCEQIESPVCKMARASAAIVGEGQGLFSDHITRDMSLQCVCNCHHASVDNACKAQHAYDPCCNTLRVLTLPGITLQVHTGESTPRPPQHTQQQPMCQGAKTQEACADVSVLCSQDYAQVWMPSFTIYSMHTSRCKTCLYLWLEERHNSLSMTW